MINNRFSAPMTKLPSEVSLLFEPAEGKSYSHHPFLTYFRGRFYAAWSNGNRNEDDCGQRVMLAVSEDGLHFSEPIRIADPMLTDDPNQVFVAAGFFTDGSTLNLYYSKFRYDPATVTDGNERPHIDAHHLDPDVFRISTEDGLHWSAPVSIGIKAMPNHGPQPTHSGRLIVAGSIAFPYTDDPSGKGPFQTPGIYGDYFEDGEVVDDSESVHYVRKHMGWDTDILCEGSFYETDDRVIHMMLRSGSGILFCTESRDDGESWCPPFQTEFSCDHSKHHFGRLPDGRFYAVCNPVPASGRNPLAICLSRDGESFDTAYILRDEPYDLRFRGLYKGGIYGYPHSLIKDEFLYVIYSKRKETIEVSRIALADLK